MFLHRCTWTILIRVEQQQALRQLAIVKALSLKQVGNNLLVIASLNKVANTSTVVVFLALAAKFVLESKLLYFVEEFLLEVGSRNIIVGSKECKQILEHTACSTTCRYKLNNLVSFFLILAPFFYILVTFFGCGQENAIAYSRSSLYF